MSHSNSNVKTYNNYSNKYNPSGSITPMMTMTITYQANTYHNSSTRVRMLNGANGEMGVVKLRPTCTVDHAIALTEDAVLFNQDLSY